MKTAAQFRNRKRFLRWKNRNTDVVQCAAIPAPASNQFTVEQWVRWDGNSNAENLLYCQEQFAQGAIRNSGHFQIAWSPNWAWVGVCPVSIGEWTHLAAVYDGAKQFLYKNGELMWSRNLTGAMVSNANVFKIGGRGTSTTASTTTFGGDIRDVRIWNVARTPEEIKHAMYGIGGKEAGLIRWWPLAEGSGTTAHDHSTTASHGTITGVTWEEDKNQPTDFLANGEFIEINENKIAFSEARENAIANGDMVSGGTPITESGSSRRQYFSVIESPFPNPINSKHVLRYLPTNGEDSEMELHKKPEYIFPGPGKYTFSVYLWVSADWDGTQQFMHLRMYDANGTIRDLSGGFPAKRGVWERVVQICDVGTRTPTRFEWYFGYPQRSTKGVVYATGFQVEYGEKVSPFGAQVLTPYAITATEIIEDPRPTNDVASPHISTNDIDGSFQSCTLGRWVGNPTQTNSVNTRSIGGSWKAALHECPEADYLEVVESLSGLEGARVFRHYDTSGRWKAFVGASYTYKKDKWYRTSVYARAPEQARPANAYIPHHNTNAGGISRYIQWSTSELSTKNWVRKYVIFQCTESANGAFYLYGEQGRGILEYAGVMIEEFDTEPVGPPPPLKKGQYISADGVLYFIGGEFVEGVEL